MSDELVFLVECPEPLELASVRGLLEGEGIALVVQGEHHAALLGGPFGNPAVTPRVLVGAKDLERARALLAARPVLDGAQGDETGGVCAVHEKASVAVCARCGAFLCSDCKVLGQPPVCESCVGIEARSIEAGVSRGQQKKRLVVWGLLFLMALPVIAAFLSRLFR